MARYTGPKNRLARKEGIDLGLKTVGTKSHAGLMKRLNVPPGQHGQKMRRKTSSYGIQLREKQKMKRLYGVMEKQFRKNFAMARKWRGNTGDMLVQFLERRLDNTVYRLGLAPTRTSARPWARPLRRPIASFSRRTILAPRKPTTSPLPFARASAAVGAAT